MPENGFIELQGGKNFNVILSHGPWIIHASLGIACDMCCQEFRGIIEVS